MTNDEPDGGLAMTTAGVLPNQDVVVDGPAVVEADAVAVGTCCVDDRCRCLHRPFWLQMACCGEKFVKDLRVMLLKEGFDALADGNLLDHSDDVGAVDFVWV